MDTLPAAFLERARRSVSSNASLPYLLLAIAIFPGKAEAQSTKVLTLPGAAVTLREDFVAVTSVRELPDGRILLSDPRDKRLVVADSELRSVTHIGRTGGGPREYQIAFPVLSWRGDSSLMADWLSRRWLMLRGAEIVGSLPPDHPVVSTGASVFGSDTLGFVLLGMQQRAPAESILVLRGGLAGEKFDTVTRLAPPVPRTNPRILLPFATNETTAIARDGWIAVVRMTPYRVDWRSPRGRWSLGSPLPETKRRITSHEKDAWIARQAKGGASIGLGIRIDWPQDIPPANTNFAPIPASDGTLLVRRNRAAEDKQLLYDIINRSGRRVAQLALDFTERIQGFGPKTMYVVGKDEDGIEHVRRYRWPLK